MRDALRNQLAQFQEIIDEYFSPFIDCVPGTQDRLNTMLGFMNAIRLMVEQTTLDRDAAHAIANRAMYVYAEQVRANYTRFPINKEIIKCRKS